MGSVYNKDLKESLFEGRVNRVFDKGLLGVNDLNHDLH